MANETSVMANEAFVILNEKTPSITKNLPKRPCVS
jgi:hypothetical protein